MKAGKLEKSWNGALIFILLFLAAWAGAAEKVRYSTPSTAEPYHLPALAAEELGFWKKHGLEVDWASLRGSVTAYHAFTAGKMDIGTDLTLGVVPAIARGVPVVMVMSVGDTDYFIWVKPGGPVASPQDLKGRRITVTSIGGGIHAYGRVAVSGLGIEKDVRFVATGGLRESLAAFLAGRVDAMVMSLRVMLKPKMTGQAKELVNVGDFMPEKFPAHVIMARREFLQNNREVVRRFGQAMLDTVTYLRTNTAWTIKKLNTEFNRTEEEAKLILEKDPRFTTDGKLTRQEVENVRSFAIKYGLSKAEEMPAVERLYSSLF